MSVALAARPTGGSGSIRQTGKLPSDARSVRFVADAWGSSSGEIPASVGLVVSLDGIELPIVELSTLGNGLTLFGGDVSQFAGKAAELVVAATFARIPVKSSNELSLDDRFVRGSVDSISFSPLPILEPSSAALLALGTIALTSHFRFRKEQLARVCQRSPSTERLTSACV